MKLASFLTRLSVKLSADCHSSFSSVWLLNLLSRHCIVAKTILAKMADASRMHGGSLADAEVDGVALSHFQWLTTRKLLRDYHTPQEVVCRPLEV